MEIVLLLIILVFVLIIYSSFNARFRESQESLKKLHEKFNALQEELEAKGSDMRPFEAEPIRPAAVTMEPLTTAVPEEIIEAPLVERHDYYAAETQEGQIDLEPASVYSTISGPVLPHAAKKSWFQTFKENNPDLEKFIGENLINKIGILILVLGVSFFVKFAIDKDWINETARVGIGILTGAIVMAVAHRLKKEYKAFSSVIVAGAISIFYFTIAIGFHDYHIFSQSIAFGIMVVITAFSSFVSVAYDRQELAVLSLIGGFAVPFMVSTGEGNYVVLFSYIALLNAGILVIAYFKKWHLVSVQSFVFTTLLFVSWYTTELYDNKLPHLGALLFSSLFYFVFSCMTLVKYIKKKDEFSLIDYGVISANTFVYFGLGLGIIYNWGIELKGLFTLSLAVYNLLYAYLLYKKFGLDRKAVYLLIGFVLTFVTLTIPIQFKGNYITLFWAAEAVLLFWMAQKSKISLFRAGAVIVQVLMLISLLFDWIKIYALGNTALTVVLNPIFITGLVAIGSLVGTYFLMKKESEKTAFGALNFNPLYYRKFILLLAVLVTYLTGILEVSYQASSVFISDASAHAFPVTFHFVFSVLLIYFRPKATNQYIPMAVIGLSFISILLYIFSFYRLPFQEILDGLTYKNHSGAAFYLHYIVIGCLAYMMIFLLKHYRDESGALFFKSKLILWGLGFAVVYILSNELVVHTLFLSDFSAMEQQWAVEVARNSTGYSPTDYEKQFFVADLLNEVRTQVIKIGYPILWGILSFLMLIFGIRKQWKQLRIMALSLLGLTVLKLFIYDINNVSETGKIIAFILLGVLVLIISFVYQKIRKLVVDEVPNSLPDEQNN